MTLEDPYFVVKDEVSKALTKTRDLFTRLDELKQVVSRCGNLSVPATPTLVNTGLPMIINAQEELEWTNTEIKNALRSIDWDLEDLEDTICIVEKNPSKFKTDHKELAVRRMFIDHTRKELKIMKDRMNINRDRDRDPSVRQGTTTNGNEARSVTPIKAPPQGHNHAQAKYSKLQSSEPEDELAMSSPHRMCLQDAMCNPNYRLPGMSLAAPKKLTHSQSDNTGILKTVSRQIGSQDLDERQVMLDDLGNEMEIITDSKYDTTMSKMARVFQLSNGNYKNKYAPAPTQANLTPPHRRQFSNKQQQLDNDYNRPIPNPCSITSTITNCFYICNRN